MSWSSSNWQPQIVAVPPVGVRCAGRAEKADAVIVTNVHTPFAGRDTGESIAIAKTHCYSADPTVTDSRYSN